MYFNRTSNNRKWFRAQDVCENISGCEWTYSGDGTDLLKKECKSIDSTASYECANHESLSRYSTIESDTFGCDKINCSYVPKKHTLVPGACEKIDQTLTADCQNKDKDLCNTTAGCIFISNDEEYCGYNRRMEKYFEDYSGFNNDFIPGKSNISDITTNVLGSGTKPTDPCLRFKIQVEKNVKHMDVYGMFMEIVRM